MPRLTDLAIKALKATSSERLVSDGNGLYLRLRPGNTPKAWIFRYTKSGKTKKMHLGAYPALGLSDARQMALRLWREHKSGLDPINERQKRLREGAALEREIQAMAQRETVSSLFERWAEIDLARRADGGASVRRMFAKDVFPAMGVKYVADIHKRDVLWVVDAVLARGANRMAKVVFSTIRQMLRFAVDRGIIDSDPTAGIAKSRIGGKDVERDRVLTDEEIALIDGAMRASGLQVKTRIAVWVVLSTCCRISELTKAKWEHVDFTKSTWLIPKENSKNRKPHIVYLSHFAVQQLQELQTLQSPKSMGDNVRHLRSPWLFPNRDGKGPIDTKTITKQICDRQITRTIPLKKRANQTTNQNLKLANGRWTPHDLRRTGATIMVSLGVLPEVAERCLNHSEESKLKRVYQQYGYKNEMRAAWGLLGDHIAMLRNQEVCEDVSKQVLS